VCSPVAGFGFGVCAGEADESESIEIHVFLLFRPCVLGHPEASGHRSQGKELLFWGDQNGGARTRRAPLGEAEAPQTAGRGNWPEAVPRTQGQNRRDQCFNRNHEVGKLEALDAEIGNAEKLHESQFRKQIRPTRPSQARSKREVASIRACHYEDGGRFR
jgi:hypothetical protein